MQAEGKRNFVRSHLLFALEIAGRARKFPIFGVACRNADAAGAGGSRTGTAAYQLSPIAAKGTELQHVRI